MESNGTAEVSGTESERNLGLAAVATNASLVVQPRARADAPSISAPDSCVFGATSLDSAALYMSNAVPKPACALASDETHMCGEIPRPSASVEKLPVSEKASWRLHSDLLPPARLIEVAHAALQSSGFRRKLIAVTHQPLQQDAQHHLDSEPSPSPAEVERVCSVKRDLSGRAA
ncbi:hypothetical protein Vretifemale_3221 [Volvox reticuliferus]|uniref:Uncharacterized protein n=1 Tax=Volvox reticuliferus TaxID=1737510 RepID=A0A8J4C0F8_9CHLO|nr:hypothetical protein Vretifemale_3221 [Volvox reticuliferus]